MKSYQLLLVSALSALLILQACGNSQQQQEQEQARRDSITQAQQEERARLDSLAQARADSIARELEGQGGQQPEKPEKEADTESASQPDKAGMSGNFTFSSDGRYTVQVEAWRNSELAQKRLQNWKDRGFDRAFISEFGSDQSGNVWYRIRLGYLPSKQQAENLKQHLMSEYETSSWISLVRRRST